MISVGRTAPKIELHSSKMTLKQLRTLLKDHPWRSYTFLNLILVVLEKLVEKDFVCPCRYGFTWAFFFLYLLMPAILALNFGVYMWNSPHWTKSASDSPAESSDSQARRPDSAAKSSDSVGCYKFCVKLLFSSLPLAIWLLLFFGEGRYVACVITPLKADYADSSDPPWEWCDSNRTLTAEQNHTKEGFLISKIVVFASIILILISVLIVQCIKYSKKGQEFSGNTKEMEKLSRASEKSTGQPAAEDSIAVL